MSNVSMAKQEIDKKLQYGKFQDGEDRKAKFRRKVAHKAVDMAMEDDPLQVINTKTGITTPGAVGIAAILGASALGYGYMNRPESPPAQPPAAVAGPYDSEYSVTFYDKDGNLIEVPHISTRPKQ